MGSCPEKPASIVASEANLPALNPNCAENPVMVVGLCGFSHCVRRSCLAKECLRSDPDPVTGLTSDQDQPCLCECASVWATWQGFQKITHFLFGDLFAFQSDGHQPPLCRQRQMAVAFTHPMAIKERTHTHTKHTLSTHRYTLFQTVEANTPTKQGWNHRSHRKWSPME